jgi:hypothetical protein
MNLKPKMDIGKTQDMVVGFLGIIAAKNVGAEYDTGDFYD